jgi:hypothetical protein
MSTSIFGGNEVPYTFFNSSNLILEPCSDNFTVWAEPIDKMSSTKEITGLFALPQALQS